MKPTTAKQGEENYVFRAELGFNFSAISGFSSPEKILRTGINNHSQGNHWKVVVSFNFLHDYGGAVQIFQISGCEYFLHADFSSW